MPRRRCYICEKCRKDGGVPTRVFLMPGEPEPPTCRHHGKMELQKNKPYNVQSKGKRPI